MKKMRKADYEISPGVNNARHKKKGKLNFACIWRLKFNINVQHFAFIAVYFFIDRNRK
jgi:hypothetical protein